MLRPWMPPSIVNMSASLSGLSPRIRPPAQEDATGHAVAHHCQARQLHVTAPRNQATGISHAQGPEEDVNSQSTTAALRVVAANSASSPANGATWSLLAGMYRRAGRSEEGSTSSFATGFNGHHNGKVRNAATLTSEAAVDTAHVVVLRRLAESRPMIARIGVLCILCSVCRGPMPADPHLFRHPA